MAEVIVVDDDSDIRKLVARIVRTEGHAVREADDGRGLVRLMREARAELVISDVFMPEMDGIEVLIKLRQEFPGTRIVVMTGGGFLGTPALLNMASTLGAHATLAKPMSEADVRAAVAQALE